MVASALKTSVWERPSAVAVTVFVPGLFPSVNRLDARPREFVRVVSGLSEPPPPVTAKVTVTLSNGLLFASRTSTTNGCANAAPV